MEYYIYKITNKINGKIYIGQHKVPKEGEGFRRYMGKGIAIKEAINKYGKENFDKEIIEYIEDDEKHSLVSEREIYWISKLNSLYPNGYNISKGGEGGCSKETARKIVETKKLRGTNRHSEETRRKQSIAAMGRKFSEEHKKHLSDSHRLKKTHIILYSSGKIELTRDSVKKIGERFNTSTIKIRRASELGNMKYGGIIMDLQNFDKIFNSMYAKCKDPIYINPITKEPMRPSSYKAWYSHHASEYPNIDFHPFNDEFKKKKELFIKEKTQEIENIIINYEEGL